MRNKLVPISPVWRTWKPKVVNYHYQHTVMREVIKVWNKHCCQLYVRKTTDNPGEELWIILNHKHYKKKYCNVFIMSSFILLQNTTLISSHMRNKLSFYVCYSMIIFISIIMSSMIFTLSYCTSTLQWAASSASRWSTRWAVLGKHMLLLPPRHIKNISYTERPTEKHIQMQGLRVTSSAEIAY